MWLLCVTQITPIDTLMQGYNKTETSPTHTVLTATIQLLVVINHISKLKARAELNGNGKGCCFTWDQMKAFKAQICEWLQSLNSCSKTYLIHIKKF